MKQPNILFIFSDQQRWDTCGCYGQPLDITPNLDRIAAEGVRFENAFTCQPVCGPDNFQTKPVPPVQRGGYKDYWLASDTLEFTSHSYDGHMFDADGNRRDFLAGRYRVDAQTDWVLEYLRTRSEAKPFFLFVSYIEPHPHERNNLVANPDLHSVREKLAIILKCRMAEAGEDEPSI